MSAPELTDVADERFEVRDRQRGEAVALKTLRTQDPDAIYWFKQEFRALADLAHPNLVSLYELLWSGGRLCFTMELLRGWPFLEYVRRPANGSTKLDVMQLRRALVQLADGLTALHQAHKLHRDVKPSNVFVTERGRVVLLDFGLENVRWLDVAM